MSDAPLAAEFLAYSRAKLIDQYWPRLRACVELLDDGQLWWRANEASNSIGNLVLHLEGNVRQWIVCGLGGEDDVRRRQAEFDQRKPVAGAELLARLHATLVAADATLGGLAAEQLQRSYRIQGYPVSGLEAVYHAVEHFSAHLGQIVYATKMLRRVDLGFYRYLEQGDVGDRKP